MGEGFQLLSSGFPRSECRLGLKFLSLKCLSSQSGILRFVEMFKSALKAVLLPLPCDADVEPKVLDEEEPPFNHCGTKDGSSLSIAGQLHHRPTRWRLLQSGRRQPMAPFRIY